MLNDVSSETAKIPSFRDYQCSDVDIDEFLTTKNIERKIKQSVSSYCKIIKKYIDNVKAKNLNDIYKCGNFIKYWIKAKIEEEHNNESENIFNYLNEYVNPLKSHLSDVNLCSNIDRLIEKYNALITNPNYSKDIALITKLYHIRCLVESNK
ncbi:variable surface protein [Plasmodium gonderi]|uniref:Variable surface protein n=1 Tax=Plasmodium gonderi TaxID=77519 RepID=A0A1Y1JPN1_PLAGO|nr:variable surface protein [Plasmodium gonderi]GAW84431.1 variable surface protein [Plasmodium gonderi]